MPRAAFFLIIIIAAVYNSSANAQLSFCNKTFKDISFAVGYSENNKWNSKGWFNIKPGECHLFSSEVRNKYYYYYAERSDQVSWNSNNETNSYSFCVHKSRAFSIDNTQTRCLPYLGYEFKNFVQLDTGDYTEVIQDFTSETEKLPEIKVANIQEKCLISWDDSFQVHSVETKITWNFQRVRTKMKKLRHCVKLTVTGPVDISGVAQQYVKSCVNNALNDRKTVYILQGIVALGADILGASGAASAANVYAYVDHVKTSALSCLTNTSNIERQLRDVLRGKFDASVKKTSHWEYWYL